MSIVSQILATITTIGFLFFGLVKVFGVPAPMFAMQREQFFDKFGIGRQGIRLIGITEWVGAGLLVGYLLADWTLGIFGALIHAMVTVGALAFHLRYGKPADGMFAVIMLVLSIAILVTFYVA